MRRVLLVIGLVAAVAVAGWSIATTRPAGVTSGPVEQATLVASPDHGSAVVGRAAPPADAVEVTVPGSHGVAREQGAHHRGRLGLVALALAALAALLGVAGRTPSAPRPPLRHRLPRSAPPFSVAIRRGPPVRPARLLTA